MSEKPSALHSSYIIDGVQHELTPAQLLDAETVGSVAKTADLNEGQNIVDETLDPIVKTFDYDSSDVSEYLESVKVSCRQWPLAYPYSYTRLKIASALIDAMWRKGNFRLENLCLNLRWEWNEDPVGAMAAFYESARSAADYADALGIWFNSYEYHKTDSQSRFCVEADCPEMECVSAVSDALVADDDSWLIYIPFESSKFRLGGSLLAQNIGLAGASPSLEDVACFVDCYEVVREFVEDGLLLSAVTVGEGGLMKAASDILGSDFDMELDISDIMRSYAEKSPVRVLFSELPGVIIQIRDYDFDYVDAELLLQDVQYFPLGHPRPGRAKLSVKLSQKSAIETILDSLMLNAEGED